jgi:hypothetical protein
MHFSISMYDRHESHGHWMHKQFGMRAGWTQRAEEYLFWDNADWNRQIGLGQ